ncbi:DUF4190 domain-containing protein [Williamsia muralis]|uniref:DUF4190 domain-containing protein n=1 Tax=Williamsia marianensis TaxID=85044 RepID=UPI00382A163B
MTQGQESDRQQPDLTKPTPAGRTHSTEPIATEPWSSPHWSSGDWQSYDPEGSGGFRDPLASLDPAYPPYPGAYPPLTYPGGSPGLYAYPVNPYATARPRTNSMANAAMICALIAVPATFICLGALLAPAAVIMGFVGLGQMKNTGETGEAQAWTGIAIGGLMTSFVLMLFMALALTIGS